jgi:putative ABC transport system permease protein
MSMLRNITSGIRSLFRKEQVGRELDEELRAYQEMAAEEKIKDGMSRKEALRAVRLERGNLEVTREIVRSGGWESIVQTSWQDVRFGLRTLRKNPGFTVVAVLTLALGIGVNTAIFSALNATILRPLPYKNTKQLVMVWGVAPSGCCRHGGMVFSSPNFLDFKDQNRVFEDMAAFDGTGFTLTSVDSPQKIHAGRVTADFFRVLQAQPILGRTFLPDENAAGHDRVVVLGYGIWQRRFGSKTNVVGQMIRLDANEYEVVGVMPHDFDFSIPSYYGPMDLWVPIVLTRDNSERGHNYLNVIARLNPGVTVRHAQAETNVIAGRLRREYSRTTGQSNAPPTASADTNEHSGVMLGTKLEPLSDEIFGDVRSPLLILFGAVGFVLLIACANVANLQLARASARQKEIALRTALGASRGRVARQLLTESVLLALVGGTLSLLLVFWLIKLLTGLLPDGMRQGTSITIDANVLVYSLTLSLATGLLFALAPIFQAFSRSPIESLKEGGRTAATGDGGLRLRSLLTVSEIAFSMVLLIGAGLLTRTFVGLLNVKPGFETENILTAKVTLPKYSYADSRQQVDFYARLLEGIASLPGVKAAGAVNDLPLDAGRDSDELTVDRRGAKDVSNSTGSSQDRLVSPDYFRVMSIPLIKGRTFTKADASSAPPVVIISQSFAQRFFPNEEPLGQHITFADPAAGAPWPTIVGVVGDVRDLALDADPDIEIYSPYQQNVLPYNPLPYMSLVVATVGEPSSLTSSVLAEIHGLDKNLPLPEAEPMAAVYSASISARRFNTLLLSIFAGIATILAAIGIYGVISYLVTRRTHEIGVRIALGANARDILALIVGRGLLLAIFGVFIGLAGALAVTRVLAKMLFGVTTTDLTTFAGMSALLIGIVFVACYVPARRAMRVDPLVALRYE